MAPSWTDSLPDGNCRVASRQRYEVGVPASHEPLPFKFTQDPIVFEVLVALAQNDSARICHIKYSVPASCGDVQQLQKEFVSSQQEVVLEAFTSASQKVPRRS